jgi:predicted hotdog family 3-hydroxylacyl-ACP dehydratase
MQIDLADLIPHQGAMCLLDSIEHWSEDRIVCRATSHQRPDHPLRDGSGLRASCAIEYAAQAVAAHASLLGRSAGRKTAIGFLTAIRDVAVSAAYLDGIDEPLTIRADVMLQRGTGLIYGFAVTAGEELIIAGRLSVMVPDTTNDAPFAMSRPETVR